MVDYLNYRNDLLTCINRRNLMILVFPGYPFVDVLTPVDILDLLSICWHAYPLSHPYQLGSYLIGLSYIECIFRCQLWRIHTVMKTDSNMYLGYPLFLPLSKMLSTLYTLPRQLWVNVPSFMCTLW